MKKVSIDNGNSFLNLSDDTDVLQVNCYWGALADAMDESAREVVHSNLAPCSRVDFLRAYLVIAQDDLVIG